MKILNAVIMIIVISLLSSEFSLPQAQKKSGIVDNVNYTTSDENIIITYDLKGSKDQLYEVKVILRRASHANFRYLPQTLTGDVGEGYFAGTGRKITWQIKKDFPSGLPGDDYYFELVVKETDDNSNVFTWVGIGLAAVAATATYIFISGNSSSDSGDNGTNATLPSPPGRP